MCGEARLNDSTTSETRMIGWQINRKAWAVVVVANANG
jgi:hypothetical protein